MVERPYRQKTAVPRVLCPVYAGVYAGGYRPDLPADAVLSYSARPWGWQFDSDFPGYSPGDLPARGAGHGHGHLRHGGSAGARHGAHPRGLADRPLWLAVG